MSKEAMKLALETSEGIVNADWRKWDELASPEEFERWVKSRANHMASVLREALAKPDFWEGYVPEPVKPAQQELTNIERHERNVQKFLAEQPAQQEVDWEKLYRLEVKKKDALAAKYERDTGKKLTRIIPMAEQPAQQEPEFFKHTVEQPYDWSEWVCPDPKGYLMKCCGCGLVHEAEFGVVRYKSATEREDCEPVDDPNIQAVFRMRRSEQWSPEDTAHRAGGLPMEQPAQQCKWPTCQSEEYQQALAQEVEHELVGEQPAQDVPEVGFGNTALDKMAENARELGLDYEPAQQEPVAKVCHDLDGHIGWNPNLRQLPDEGTALYAAPPAQRPHECSRSHPHENMDAMCELRTEIARLTNENARLKALHQDDEINTYRMTLLCIRDGLQQGMSKSIQKLQAREINDVLGLPSFASYRTSPPAQPAQQEPVAFLANGTRFKISYDNRQSGGQIHGIPPELGGRWVAFVAADDDCHLKLTSPPRRTWVGLSDEEKRQLFDREDYQGWLDYINAIEAKLRSKNEDRN